MIENKENKAVMSFMIKLREFYSTFLLCFVGHRLTLIQQRKSRNYQETRNSRAGATVISGRNDESKITQRIGVPAVQKGGQLICAQSVWVWAPAPHRVPQDHWSLSGEPGGFAEQSHVCHHPSKKKRIKRKQQDFPGNSPIQLHQPSVSLGSIAVPDSGMFLQWLFFLLCYPFKNVLVLLRYLRDPQDHPASLCLPSYTLASYFVI